MAKLEAGGVAKDSVGRRQKHNIMDSGTGIYGMAAVDAAS